MSKATTQFILCKQGRRWAIYDTTARVYYYGKKQNLEQRLVTLNTSQRGIIHE